MTEVTDSTAQRPRGTNHALGRVLLIAAAAIAIALVPLISGLVGALVLYVTTRPAFERLRRHVPVRLAAIAVVAGVVALLLAPGAWLASTLVIESRELVRSRHLADPATWLAWLPFGNDVVAANVAETSKALVGWLSQNAVAAFGTVTSALVNVMIALFGLYFLLMSGPLLWRRLLPLMPFPEPTADALAARFVNVTNALLLGTVLTACIQGILVGVAFAIVGLTPAALWGFITACVAVLPVFGSALVWFPATTLLLVQHRTGAGLFVGVLGAGVVSNIDNVIRLAVYRRVSGIHPMVTLVGAFAGLRALGIAGALIGPLVLSYFTELLDVYQLVNDAGKADSSRSLP